MSRLGDMDLTSELCGETNRNEVRCLAAEIIIQLYKAKCVADLQIIKGQVDQALELLKNEN